jgi:hypothetical protein
MQFRAWYQAALLSCVIVHFNTAIRSALVVWSSAAVAVYTTVSLNLLVMDSSGSPLTMTSKISSTGVTFATVAFVLCFTISPSMFLTVFLTGQG